MKANIVSGFALNYLINIAILPVLYDKAHNLRSAFLIGCVFTVASVCRQLFIRRRMDKIKRFQTVDEAFVAEALHYYGTNVPVESLGREHA